MRRGSAATLPDYDHRRTPPLPAGSLVVRHVEEDGRRARDYDFGELPVASALRRELAELFAARVGPDGTWRQLISSREVWVFVVAFCRFLSEQEEAVETVADLNAGIWASWRLSRPANTGGRRAVSKVQALLREHPRLPAETRELMAKRVSAEHVTEGAYTPEEFERIKRFAAGRFRSALLRIRENQQLLDSWRAGVFAEGSEQHRVGEVLDYLARHGELEHYVGRDGRTRPRSAHWMAMGAVNAEATWKRLFLDSEESAALIILMIATYGWNVTTVAELQVPESAPDAGADGRTIYRVELRKRRRHIPHRYETRNLADFGADSPGRLIAQAIEATAPARAAMAALGTPSSDLILWRPGQRRYGLFRTGYGEKSLESWPEQIGVKDLNCRRLRKTVMIGKREPSQHSEDVHDRVYVLPDPRTAAEAAGVIEAGIADAVGTAHAAFAAKVSRSEIEAATDTATASCTDYTNSPITGPGSPCRASFLLCTACPNAVVTPRHLPRLAYLLDALSHLRSVLAEPVWEADWREHYRRLVELRSRPEFTDTEWRDALAQASEEDREMIDTLLHRGFDA